MTDNSRKARSAVGETVSETGREAGVGGGGLQSTTNLMPGTVMLVSAMLVATTSLRVPSGGSSNTRW